MRLVCWRSLCQAAYRYSKHHTSDPLRAAGPLSALSDASLRRIRYVRNWSRSGHAPVPCLDCLGRANDAVDGASSAASKCYRLVASKPTRFKGGEARQPRRCLNRTRPMLQQLRKFLPRRRRPHMTQSGHSPCVAREQHRSDICVMRRRVNCLSLSRPLTQKS